MKTLILLMVLAQPDTVKHPQFLELAYLASTAVDIHTTLIDGMAGYRVNDWYGWHEANPIGAWLLDRGGPTLFVAGSAAYAVGVVLLTRKVRVERPTWANAMLILGTAVHVACAWQNYRRHRRLVIRFGAVRP